MIRLEYQGKKDETEILNTEVKGYGLNKVATYGSSRLDGWENRLILGDNFIALKLLLKDSAVKGKVRLIYIDPPFATNQVFKIGEDRTATISSSEKDGIAYEDHLKGI